MPPPLVVTAAFDSNRLQYLPAYSDRFVYSRQFVSRRMPVVPIYRSNQLKKILTAVGDSPVDMTNIREVRDMFGTDDPFIRELIKLLERSEFGFVFLDRTRIRPYGIAVGEPVYGLSLAPGEEVTIEQKSFTKREISLEEILERERTLELELSSTLTSELQDSLDEVRKLEAELRGNVGGDVQPLALIGAVMGLVGGAGGGSSAALAAAGAAQSTSGGAPLNVHADAQPTLRASDEITRKHSVKQTVEQTAKSTAKYRSLHKTTFTVKTESSFESRSQRVIRNPNRATPLDLQFFKILRVEQLTQERTGVRLCWAPWVGDPGQGLRTALAVATKSQREAAESTRPRAPQARQAELSTIQDIAINGSFGPIGDVSGRTNEPPRNMAGIGFAKFYCDIPEGWEWDHQTAKAWLVFPGTRAHRAFQYRLPNEETNPPSTPGGPWQRFINFYMDIEIDGTTSTVAGAMANAMGVTHLSSSEPLFNEETFIHTQIGLVPVRTSDETAAYNDYMTQLGAWERENGPSLAQAAVTPPAPPEFDALSELMKQMVDFYFPSERRDDYWEVEFWHRLFEWESATYALYPGWWRTGTLPRPDLPATHFLNASWARLFLTVRPGYERLALRWIVGREIETPLDTSVEAELDTLLAEMTEYRTTQFGDPLETPVLDAEGNITDRFVTLARWQATMPTDGTHLEVVQGITTAADDATTKEIEDASRLRDMVINRKTEENSIIQRSGALITAEPKVEMDFGGANGT